MIDNNVLHELEVKNKEIYLNKLQIDLDNNNDILLITIDNLHNLFNQELLNNILEILSSTYNRDNISNSIKIFSDKIKEELIRLIKEKVSKLKEESKNIDSINYREIIDNETLLIIDQMKKNYQNHIIDLINNIINDYTMDKKDRIEEYLKNIFFNKYIKKVEEIIKNMDNILYNNYQESKDKFEDLNERTMKL